VVVGDVCELWKEVERTEMATDRLNIAGKLRELTNQFYASVIKPRGQKFSKNIGVTSEF
jgi:hypothetical protein